ncbi:octopamine receptor beta-2R [Nematostella vectensis]|uniref:octopamine receptor beta-2R n=1 Tax=Nematostella vectensis TaxID=45351 RepID=UPI002076EF53|nr:octopamine receptor beta-2R [Nematostella vectensis]
MSVVEVNSTNSSVQSHTWDMSYPTWYWVLRGVIALVTITGNLLVIYLITTRRHLRTQHTPNWTILSLSMADLLVGLFNLPTSLLCMHWTTCSFITQTTVFAVMDAFMICSVTNLCLLTWDRYLAVMHPFSYGVIMTKKNVILMIMVCWSVSVIQGVPYYISKLLNHERAMYASSVVYALLFTALPNLFTVYAYSKIILVVRRHRKQIQEHEVATNRVTDIVRVTPTIYRETIELEANEYERQLSANHGLDLNRSMTTVYRKWTDVTPNEHENSDQAENRQKSSQNSMIIAVGVLNLIFLVCNTAFEYYLTCKLIRGCIISDGVIYVTFLLRYFNSAPNFFVYALVRRSFRREIKMLGVRLWREK